MWKNMKEKAINKLCAGGIKLVKFISTQQRYIVTVMAITAAATAMALLLLLLSSQNRM